MRKLPLVAAALLVPWVAVAQPTFAARLAYAPALGDVAAHVPMSEAMRSQIPLQLDALWRFGDLAAGVYAAYGLGQVPASACAGGDCSASDVRVGVQGLLALEPRSGVVPWVGAGVGYEWATERRARADTRTTWSFRGLDALVQGGAEWNVAGRFSAGPFAALALGRYAHVALDTPDASGSADIPSKGFHAWILVGVRGRLDL